MKNWYKLLNREDFGTVADENSYQITFKGSRIGGAGFAPEHKVYVSEENKMLQIEDFKKMAATHIEKILNGSGDPLFYKQIKKIMDI